MTRCAALIASVLWMTAAAHAQVVQLPSVDVFSVDTVVSVPDRGSMFLGGVRSHAGGKATAGPLRSGTAWGQASSASSASAHVWIHDFEAMDAELLAQGRPTASSSGPLSATAPATRADRARAQLTRLSAGSGTGPLPQSLSPAPRSAVAPLRTSPRSLTVQPLQYNLIR